MDANATCIEELCYLIAKNPFLVTDELKDPELLRWIEKECALPELSGILRPHLAQGKTLKGFVDALFDYTGYLLPEERAAVDETLLRNEGLNEYEKRLSQADYLLSHRKMESAIEEYESLLSDLPKAEDPLRIRILMGIGEAYAGLFMFDAASRYFKHAYDLSGKEDALLKFLFCLRMVTPEERYLAYGTEHPEYARCAAKLEEMMAQAMESFEATKEHLCLSALSVYRDEGNKTSWQGEMGRLLADQKERYLTMVAD